MLGQLIKEQIERLARWWCRNHHHNISRPVNQTYRCWTCLREYKNDWEPMTWVRDPAPVERSQVGFTEVVHG